MIKKFLFHGAVCAASLGVATAHADVAEVVGDVVTPAYSLLHQAAEALDAAAQQDCSASALRAPFQQVWDAWAAIDFFHIGPVETDGRALAISFWPDPKSSGARAQQALLDNPGEVLSDPARFADLSVAMRGLSGLERLIYPSALKTNEDLACRARRATAADLAATTAQIDSEWAEFRTLLLAPGEGDNTLFLDENEARQAIYTEIVTGLEFLADTRLGRPLGSFDKPRPERAEAIPAGRSLRNVKLSLEGMRDAALALHEDAPLTRTAFERAITLADDLDDPVFAGVSDPQSRLKVEILQQAIGAAQEAVIGEIGQALGLSVGFNSKDGD